jgi:hypothetical protein
MPLVWEALSELDRAKLKQYQRRHFKTELGLSRNPPPMGPPIVFINPHYPDAEEAGRDMRNVEEVSHSA